uniref:Uncharacterized protein n=1 Tax=Crocodylus porosus TaxID=8502 RepID=A0A7M4EU12_CROPO
SGGLGEWVRVSGLYNGCTSGSGGMPVHQSFPWDDKVKQSKTSPRPFQLGHKEELLYSLSPQDLEQTGPLTPHLPHHPAHLPAPCQLPVHP